MNEVNSMSGRDREVNPELERDHVLDTLLSPYQETRFAADAQELAKSLPNLPQEIATQAISTMVDVLNEIQNKAEVIASLSPEDQTFLAGRISEIPSFIIDVLLHFIHDFPANESFGTITFDQAGTPLVTDDQSGIRQIIVDGESVGNHLLFNHFPALRQLYRDAVTVAQIGDQRNNPLYVNYQKAKAEFYRQYENMGKASATTSSVDIPRALSLLQKNMKSLPSIVFGGCGNMRRFEGPLLDQLYKNNQMPSKIIAVDRVNQADRITEPIHNVPITFIQSELTDAIKGNRYSAIVCPWSMTCDVLTHLDRISLLQSLADGLEEGGILIIDNACPVGEHSYHNALDAQAVQAGQQGVFMRSFDGPDGEKLWSAFHIIELEKLCRDAAQVGLVPVNIPPRESDQKALIAQTFANESKLTERAENHADTDAQAFPFYQANGNNRYTIGFRKMTPDEARAACGAPRSLLHSLLAMKVDKS